jgi:O-antigen ligase
MIVYGIKLAILSAIAILSVVFSSKTIFSSGLGKRIVAFWIIALPLIFILRNEALTLMAALCLLILVNKKNSGSIFTIAFFIGILGAIPDWVEYHVSVPGINYLITLAFYKVAVFALLVPLLFQLKKGGGLKWGVTDSFVCLFVLVTTLLTFREGKFTTVLRFFIDSCLVYIVPYFVLSRLVKTINDFHYCAVAVLVFSIIISAILFVSQVIQLDIYEAFNPRSKYNIIREYRGGFLRLSGPLSSPLIGFTMLSGYLALDILKKHISVLPVIRWLIILMFFLAVLFSGSRGGLFSFILGVAVYWYFIKLSSEKRVLLVLSVVILFLAELLFGISAMFIYEDEYGTFDYRVELYTASWLFLKQNPLFGMQNFLYSGYFDHLVTGFGIIDIVSTYLQIALKYGFVGLFLFFSMFLSIIIPLAKRLLSIGVSVSDVDRYTVMYFAINIALMFIISTTSMISLFPIFIMINISFGRAILARY